MAIDPKLLVIKPVDELERVTGLQAGDMLFYDGSDNLKRISIDTFNNLSQTAKPLKPTDPTPIVEGLYVPTESGTYTNAGGLVAQEGYYTLFFFDGTTWTKTESLLPGVEVAPEFDPVNDEDAQGGKQIYTWLYGDDSGISFGGTTAITHPNMTTVSGFNATITYWLYPYIVPYSRCILSEFQINMNTSGFVSIKRYKKSGTSYLYQNHYEYPVAAGVNTINILTAPDKNGVIHNFWEWQSDDIISIYSTAGLRFTTTSNPLSGAYGYGSNPSDHNSNIAISSLTTSTVSFLVSVKFIEVISAPIPGKVVGEISESTALDPENIPNVEAVLKYASSSNLKQLTDIILVPSFGQSLAGGTDGGASTFSVPVDIAYTTGNVNSNVQDMNGGYIETFKEMAKQNAYNLPEGFKFMSSVAFLGGTCITDLSKGTTTYNSLLSQVTTAKNTATSLGKSFSVPAFCWTQGEEDYRAGGNAGAAYGSGKYIPTEYATKLIKLVDDLNTDIKAITGQIEDVKCVMYQVASHNPYGRYPRIAIEQLKAATLDKRIILAKTMYDVEYNAADNVHAPNKTYRNMGNHYGIGLFNAIVKNEHMLPVYPIKSQLAGNVLYIQFHVPVKPLVFDDTWVSPLTDGKKGFALYNVTNEFTTSATITASATTITSVELINSDTVKITLSGVPTAGTRLTYGVNGLGYDVVNGNTTTGTRRSGRIDGARGNLRDSQTYFNPVSNYFNLYNWSSIFEIVF